MKAPCLTELFLMFLFLSILRNVIMSVVEQKLVTLHLRLLTYKYPSKQCTSALACIRSVRITYRMPRIIATGALSNAMNRLAWMGFFSCFHSWKALLPKILMFACKLKFCFRLFALTSLWWLLLLLLFTCLYSSVWLYCWLTGILLFGFSKT